MILKATKIFKFEAVHHLPKHLGLCKQPHGHGYKMHVTFLKTIIEPKIPSEYPYMVADFGDIKKIINPIIKILDHAYLNEIFGDIDPTAENMVIWIAKKIWKELNNTPIYDIKLDKIRLFETDSSYIDLEGI